MEKPSSPDGAQIQALLAERNQYVVWLQRLDAQAASAPDLVRQRVRADYQQRLDAVTERLRAHRATIADDLARYRTAAASLEARVSEAEERLAEAEVRHAVGEYEEAHWESLRAELTGEIESGRAELERARSEIARLSEVEAHIAGAPAPAPAPAPAAAAPAAPTPRSQPPAAPSPAPEPFRATPPSSRSAAPGGATRPPSAPTSTSPAGPAAPTAPPRPEQSKPPEPPVKTLWFPSGKGEEGVPQRLDELDFLRSVTEDEPAPKRSAGAGPRAPEPSAPAPTPPAPSPPAPSPVVRPIQPVQRQVEEPTAIPLPEPEPLAPTPDVSPPPDYPDLITEPTVEVLEEPVQEESREQGGRSGEKARSAAVTPTAGSPAAGTPAAAPGGKTLRCGECGTFNRPTEWYCEQCGAELAAL